MPMGVPSSMPMPPMPGMPPPMPGSMPPMQPPPPAMPPGPPPGPPPPGFSGNGDFGQTIKAEGE